MPSPGKSRKYDPEYARQWYQNNKERIKRRNLLRRDEILAYQKEWYAKNREEHIAKVTARKRTEYAGACVVCGKATMSQSKNAHKPRFCKDHRKEQWEEKLHNEQQRLAWREAKRAQRARDKARGATPGDRESKRQSSAEKTQAGLAAATHKSASFSRLTRSADRDQGETNGSPPPGRKWASP